MGTSTKEYHQAWRERNREKINATRKAAYAADPEGHRAYQKAWREKNREKIRAQRKALLAHEGSAARAWQTRNRAEISRRAAARARARRLQVLNAYGGKCACCGVSNWQFLAIDHVNGGGERHRKSSRGYGDGLVLSIIRENYPPTYRVLCHNCNQAKGYYGACPHGNC